jgi:subtilisin family serine protease
MPSFSPHVINNSWGCPPSEGCNTGNFAIMDTVINNLRAAGIVVVVSAGNAGPSCSTVEDPAAIFPGSFTVGATTVMDSISGFSSRGPVTVDGSNRIKPDVSAPGSGIRSSTPGGNYATWSGTSMAGPHVAGAVALLISARPSLAGKVDSIELILKQTAVKLLTDQSCNGIPSSSYPNNTYGHGRIDIMAAVTKALQVGVNNPKREIQDVMAYPNPFSNRLVFHFSGIPSAQVTIKIFTATGQLLLFRNFLNQKELAVDMDQFSSGLYLYRIETPEKVYYGKVAKK